MLLGSQVCDLRGLRPSPQPLTAQTRLAGGWQSVLARAVEDLQSGEKEKDRLVQSWSRPPGLAPRPG